MKRRMWINLALLLVVPGMLMTVSCAKKMVKTTPVVSQDNEAAQAAERARQAELARQQELARQKALQEQRLKDEAAQKEAAAREQFVNEDVHFDFDKSDIKPEAAEILKAKAQFLSDKPNLKVQLQGNCDERGTAEYNLALGQRRADSAKAFLVNLGVPAAQLSTISFGKEKPLDPAHNEAAWAKNRRVHCVILP